MRQMTSMRPICHTCWSISRLKTYHIVPEDKAVCVLCGRDTEMGIYIHYLVLRQPMGWAWLGRAVRIGAGGKHATG